MKSLDSGSSLTDAPPRPGYGRPQIIFFCELPAPDLQVLLEDGTVLDELVAEGYALALAIRQLDEPTAAVLRLLNHYGVPVIAWLLLAPSEGSWLHLQNYPQAMERYQLFSHWARTNGLHVQAIGLDIEPPSSELDRIQQWGLREITRRIWLARENVLYPAAYSAYTDLIGRMHHDGYEVHTYQLPLLADDRRAGTSLVQRALDIIDLPADLEVLMCFSSVPLDRLGGDLGGALITSYGPTADGIAVGTLAGSTVYDGSAEGLPPLAWEALERDLLLAAHHTDTIYIYSLEGCIERGLLPRLAELDWSAEVRPVHWKGNLVNTARFLLLSTLLSARFSRSLLAWLGWVLFALSLARQWRIAARMRRRQPF